MAQRLADVLLREPHAPNERTGPLVKLLVEYGAQLEEFRAAFGAECGGVHDQSGA